ncbi:MAG: hypothetical protein LAT58_08325 [Opitutales bacterium]|nr:hypothetical protein [Opitutales bacterium]
MLKFPQWFVLKRAWHSPTFTSWANMGIQSSRLVLFLPLLIYFFDDIELAAWLLFSSLTFLSGAIGEKTSEIFSRMTALAMGGAKDLSPITEKSKSQSIGSPNWLLVRKIYSTTGILNLGVAVIAALSIGLLGIFALPNLLQDYEDPSKIWGALLIFALTISFSAIWKRYTTTLRGMGHVALMNRWGAFFGGISVLAGSGALLLGADIFILTIVMQTFTLLNCLRSWLILQYVAKEHYKTWNAFGWEKEVISYGWPVFWRSLIQRSADKASLTFALIYFARTGSPDAVAALLLSVRVLETLVSFASAPLSSKVPILGKILAEGNIPKFGHQVLRSIRLATWVFVAGAAFIIFALPSFVNLLGNFTFLPRHQVGLLCLVFFLYLFLRFTIMVPMIGNTVVAVPRLCVAALGSLVLSITLIPIFEFWGFLIAALGPYLLVLNIAPLQRALSLTKLPIKPFLIKTFAGQFGSLLAIVFISFC